MGMVYCEWRSVGEMMEEVAVGSLFSHHGTLGEAGLLEVEKRFVDKRSKTTVEITKAGREAIDSYWEGMERLRELAQDWASE